MRRMDAWLCHDDEGRGQVIHLEERAERARNRTVMLPGHFTGAVRIETLEEIGASMAQVRASDGRPDETTLMAANLEATVSAGTPVSATGPKEQTDELGEKLTGARRDLDATLDDCYARVIFPVRASSGGQPWEFEDIDPPLPPHRRPVPL